MFEMKGMKCDETRRGYTFIGVLGITVLALLIIVGIAEQSHLYILQTLTVIAFL